MIIASIEAVRQAYSASSNETVKSFSPQLSLNIGMRISQVSFSADEEWLVLSAENGGGLAVYQVQSLVQGGTQSAFELSTNGVSVRELVPNPTAEKAELFAVVTMDGQLLMANLKTRQFLNHAQAHNLKEGVSCLSWSTRGKQLVAGLGNGTCFQMTPEGEGKADLPAPPGLEGSQYGKTCILLRARCVADHFQSPRYYGSKTTSFSSLIHHRLLILAWLQQRPIMSSRAQNHLKR